MSRDRYVLDTSAILTFIEDEDGADRVEAVLREHPVTLPFLVLMETYYITLQERDEAEADRRYALLRETPASIVWEMDEPTVLTAAHFKADFRLSLADALIAALAKRKDAILLHKDPEYDALAGQVRMEPLPYKSTEENISVDGK